jgi:putative ABC transport system ATP-binding protein
VEDSLGALTLRAPVAGRLTNFTIQPGQMLKPGDPVGQVDSEGAWKMVADVDEYYLGHVQVGQQARGEGDLRLTVTKVLPAVTDGRFRIELAFVGAAPQGLHRGQTIDLRITLGATTMATLAPVGGWLDSGGGSSAFVLDASGTRASRRPVKVGRRNPEMAEILSGFSRANVSSPQTRRPSRATPSIFDNWQFAKNGTHHDPARPYPAPLPLRRGRDHRASRHQSGGRQGRFPCHHGPLGLRQVHPAQHAGHGRPPERGRYLFGDRDLAALDEAALARFRSETLGFVFQSFNLIDELTIRENVELGLVYRKDAAGDRRARVEAAMDRVGISHRARHFPHQLSGGQQQRAAIARAIVGNPQLILADEPTGNLDTENGAQVMDILTSLNAEGATIVMVTHSPSHADIARRRIDMLDGRIVSSVARAI